MENVIILGFVDNTVSIINTPSCYSSVTIDNLQVSGHHYFQKQVMGPDLADKSGLLATVYTSIFSSAISLCMGEGI